MTQVIWRLTRGEKRLVRGGMALDRELGMAVVAIEVQAGPATVVRVELAQVPVSESREAKTASLVASSCFT